MGSFKDFLVEREDRVRAEEATKEAKKRQWIAAVRSLLERMEVWLKESDPGNLLRLRTRKVERREESIGAYVVPILSIDFGSRVVRVEPVAQNVMGPMIEPREGYWSGRVDLVGPPYKFQLFRFSGSDDLDDWFIRDTRNYRLVPFDKESFDQALVELFS